VSQRIHSIADVSDLVGTHLGHSRYLSITQTMISTFADATHDHQWIHVDVDRAATGPFGRTIAHGYLVLSLIPSLLNEVFDVEVPGTRINYGLNRVRFVTPVPVQSELRLGAVLTSAQPKVDSWEIILDVTMELRDSPRPACVAQVIYRWYPQ
jgi:acyl dehydratase